MYGIILSNGLACKGWRDQTINRIYQSCFLLCWLQWGQGSGYDFHFRTPLNQLKIFKTVLTATCRTTDIWLNLYQLNNQTVIPGCYYSSKLPMKTLEQVLKSVQS